MLWRCFCRSTRLPEADHLRDLCRGFSSKLEPMERNVLLVPTLGAVRPNRFVRHIALAALHAVVHA